MRMIICMAMALFFLSLQNIYAEDLLFTSFEEEFERDFGFDGRGGGVFQQNASTVEACAETPYKGKYCARVALDEERPWLTQENPGWKRGYIGGAKKIALKGEKSLMLEFFLRFNADAGHNLVVINFFDSSGQSMRSEIKKTLRLGSKDWEPVSIPIDVPENPESLRIAIWGYGTGDQSFDIDEVRLYKGE